jgi:hypothetical protein
MNTPQPPVPPRYRGVWQRTLLQTPEARDDSTFVRWLQTAHWHADLRVPLSARPSSVSAPTAAALSRQQGFAGRTEITAEAQGEICHWHRELDLQPPGPHPDAGWMQFETPERVIETGVHGHYREVWERLPGSTGRSICLGRSFGAGRFAERLLLAGRYLMRVRARTAAWPALQPGDTLAEIVARHPQAAAALLDFEISFGTLAAGRWQIERSTLPALEGRDLPCRIERSSATEALVHGASDSTAWTVTEWRAPAQADTAD